MPSLTKKIRSLGKFDDFLPARSFLMHHSVYPYMRIKLHAPVEVQNLLPFDFKYKVYDEKTGDKWTNFLRKGGVSPVHTVELSHTLMIDLDMQTPEYNKSDYAIINSLDRESFKRDKTIIIKDKDGIPLRLKLHYL